ncbi:MAG TPA: hypothetical protein VMR52_07410 [Dehalococcoidia bacterium]|nr:hypothetical protein [Dehalococcoidia bacterium]
MPSGARLSALAGFASGISFLVALALLGDLLGAFGDPDHVFVEHFADTGNRAPTLVGSVLLILGGLLFLPFATRLSGRLFDSDSPAANTVRSLGAVAVALVCVAASLLMTVDLSRFYADIFDEELQPIAGDNVSIAPQIGYIVLLLAAAYIFAAIVGTISVARLASAGMGDIGGWLGVIVACLSLLSPMVMPFVLLPLWVIAWSVALWRTPAPGTMS